MTVIIDIRRIPPNDRHGLVLNWFKQLTVGQAILVVSDHDPCSLFAALSAGQIGRFSWDYDVAGPDLWRIRIGRD